LACKAEHRTTTNKRPDLSGLFGSDLIQDDMKIAMDLFMPCICMPCGRGFSMLITIIASETYDWMGLFQTFFYDF
jgi:hypothetical protein